MGQQISPEREGASRRKRPEAVADGTPWYLRWIPRVRSRGVVILLSLFTGLVIWEVAGRLIHPLFFAPFSKVILTLGKMAAGKDLWVDIYVTVTELALGFSIGVAIGLLGGILSGLNRPFRNMTDLWVSFLYSTPYVAIIPLIILWLGLGMASKVAIGVFAVFIPVWWNTYLGITSTDPNLVEVARTFGANNFQVLSIVLLRSGLPSILVGLRLAFSRGLIGVITAEFLASTQGVGFMINRAGNMFQSSELLAGVLLLGGGTMAVVEFLKWLEVKMAPWGFGR